MVALGNNVSQQLQRLGIPAETMGAQLQQMSGARLQRLSSSLNVSLGPAVAAANKFSHQVNDARWNIAGPLANPTPGQSVADRGSFVRGSYFEAQPLEHASASDPFPALLNRFTRRGVIVARALHRDPVLREAFEKQAALIVVPDRRADGGVSVSAMTHGGGGGHGSTGGVPQSAWDMFMQMDAAVMREAAKLGNIAMAGSDIYGASPGAYGEYYTNPAGGAFGMANDDYFSGSGLGQSFDTSAGTDEKVLVVKRMMDKRNQMYDAWKNVLDKHNESAKTAIGNLKA